MHARTRTRTLNVKSDKRRAIASYLCAGLMVGMTAREGGAGVTYAPGSGAGREGRGYTRCRQMTPVARPPRSVHPRPYTRCSTVLFLRVLAYAHEHLHTRDAVGFARTFARACAYIRTDCTS